VIFKKNQSPKFRGRNILITAGNPKLFIPSIELVTNADSTLEKIQIQWYGYENGTYVLQTDRAVIDKLI